MQGNPRISAPWGPEAAEAVTGATGNLFELVRSRFPAESAAPFIETLAGHTYTYADLEEISGRYARLLGELGIQKGDRVAVQVEKSPEAIFLYLACLRVGAVYLPLNPDCTAPETEYFLNDARPTLFVCRPENEDAGAETAQATGVPAVLTLGADGGGSLTESSHGLDPDVGCAATEPDDLAALLYTSGTTGRAKGAMLSHANLGTNALALNHVWSFTPDDVLLHALPIFHTHGLFVAINCVLLSGAKMLFMPKFDAETVTRLLPEATVMMGVPTFYTRLLAYHGFTRDVCSEMRLFISGSAPLLAETFHAFEARTGMTILERYGMSETGMSTSNPLDGERIAGTVGFPLPGIEARIAGEDGKILPAGEIGVLEVRGPNVFSGYWRMPEMTETEFRPDGFFITGDIARIDERGYVHIVGRAKDLIISGGVNVYPREVELCIDDLDGVVESAVIGLAHPDFGEAVSAVVVPESENVSADAIIAACKGALAKYKVPKRVFFVAELPRNSMGKVQKNDLRERYKDAFTGAA